jgi:hypothetical protein
MTIIHLCAVAWNLYDLRKWRALDKHRAMCGECYRREVDA